MYHPTTSCPKGKRSIRISSPFNRHGVGCVTITQKGKPTVYACKLFLAFDGIALGVKLVKLDGTTYYACLNGNASSCECLSFLRWGHCRPCKHIAGLQALADAGRLANPATVHAFRWSVVGA